MLGDGLGSLSVSHYLSINTLDGIIQAPNRIVQITRLGITRMQIVQNHRKVTVTYLYYNMTRRM